MKGVQKQIYFLFTGNFRKKSGKTPTCQNGQGECATNCYSREELKNDMCSQRSKCCKKN